MFKQKYGKRLTRTQLYNNIQLRISKFDKVKYEINTPEDLDKIKPSFVNIMKSFIKIDSMFEFNEIDAIRRLELISNAVNIYSCMIKNMSDNLTNKNNEAGNKYE